MDDRDAQFLLHEKYGGVSSAAYEEDCAHLRDGVPVDYLIGWKPFLDCKIFLDSRPLIPRAETEYWVEKAIHEINQRSVGARLKILDLFSGSGAIGVAILKHLPFSDVDFGEIDGAHPPTIRKNIRENGLDERHTDIIETDVWERVSGRYDFIFANPPYLSQSRLAQIEVSVLSYEPGAALFAGEDGFALIRKTIEGVSAHLSPNGALYLEHEPEQSQAIALAAKQQGLLVKTHMDQFGRERWSIISVA